MTTIEIAATSGAPAHDDVRGDDIRRREHDGCEHEDADGVRDAHRGPEPDAHGAPSRACRRGTRPSTSCRARVSVHGPHRVRLRRASDSRTTTGVRSVCAEDVRQLRGRDASRHGGRDRIRRAPRTLVTEPPPQRVRLQSPAERDRRSATGEASGTSSGARVAPPAVARSASDRVPRAATRSDPAGTVVNRRDTLVCRSSPSSALSVTPEPCATISRHPSPLGERGDPRT